MSRPIESVPSFSSLLLSEESRIRPWVILGSEGFVGKYLVEELLKLGCSVHCLDIQKTSMHRGVKYTRIDVKNQVAMDSYVFPDNAVVVHLAAKIFTEETPQRSQREKYFSDNNFEGTRHLLHAMLQQGCRDLVYFTTDMVYGTPQHSPLDETHPRRPNGPYGYSKLLSEELCEIYRKEHGFRITIFRPRMILGTGRLGILKKLFFLIRHSLPVPMIGDGTNCYQMVSVSDCVQAVLCAANKDFPNEAYNMGSENPPSVRHLLHQLITKHGSRSILVPTPSLPIQHLLQILDKSGWTLMFPEQFLIAHEHYVLDVSKARRQLDWTPRYSDEEMLELAYKEYLRLFPHGS